MIELLPRSLGLDRNTAGEEGLATPSTAPRSPIFFFTVSSDAFQVCQIVDAKAGKLLPGSQAEVWATKHSPPRTVNFAVSVCIPLPQLLVTSEP